MIEKLKKHLPEILTGLGIIGCAAVGVSAARAQHKVEEDTLDDDIEPTKKQLLEIYIKHYALPTIIFAITSGCIYGSNKLSRKNYERLLKGYASVGAGFAAYRTAVVERYGEKVDEELCEESVAVLTDPSYVNLLDQDVPCEPIVFEEPYTGIRFKMTERDVILAEYHLNRNFALGGGSVSLAELFYFLGIDPPRDAANMGWNAEHGYYWIDIAHEKHIDRHGNVYYMLNYMFPPEEDFEDYISYPGEDAYQETSYVGNC